METRPKVCHFTDVPALDGGDEAPGVTIRWLIDEENDGAPHYALRLVEVEPGGHTPHHEHPYEHENYVLAGRGRLRIGESWHEVATGSVMLVPANARHMFENTGDEPFRFLCGIPVSRHITKD
jgi:quercetin dioxygenase-like cupin family protein